MKKLAGILVLVAAANSNAAEQGTASAQDAAAYWTAGYAGPDVAALRCDAPDVPEVSHFNLPIRNVARAIEQWQECQRRTLASLDPGLAGSTIPAEALAAMSPEQRAAAVRHVAAVHARLADFIRHEAAPVLARHEAWRDATVRYVAAQNGLLRAGDAAVRRNRQIARATQADERRQRRSATGPAVR